MKKKGSFWVLSLRSNYYLVYHFLSMLDDSGMNFPLLKLCPLIILKCFAVQKKAGTL